MAFGCSDVLKSSIFDLYSWTLGYSDVLKVGFLIFTHGRWESVQEFHMEPGVCI